MSIHRHDDALGTWSVVSCTPCPALTAHVSTLWFGAGQVHYQRDRILRFQRAMELLPRYQHVPWAELAANCGYYDQSHLIRDFRTFSGCAPCDLLQRERPDRNSVVVR